MRERWGRGPRRSHAYWAGPDALLVVLDDAHTEAERTLLEHDRSDEVLAGRRLLGALAEPELRQIAEDATDRHVKATLSQSIIAPPVTTVAFLFAPRGGNEADDEPLGATLREALDRTDSARALVAEGAQVLRRSAEGRARSQAARDAREGGEGRDGA